MPGGFDEETLEEYSLQSPRIEIEATG